MYNKLFTQILDSSIWLAPDPHRLVWITLIAAMDQNGMARFACAANLAARARVSLEDTEAAIAAFEAPDPYEPSQEYEGRRIERIPGGWFVLNAEKYRGMVTRAVATEQSRVRMQKHRDKLRNVTQQLQTVTPSEAVSVSVSEAVSQSKNKNSKLASLRSPAPRKRCPENFQITEAMRAWATEKCPWVNLDQETEAFRDYEFARGKTDWTATWRTWMRKVPRPKTAIPLKDRLTWRPGADDVPV